MRQLDHVKTKNLTIHVVGWRDMEKTMKIFISNNPESLVAVNPHVTVEAEYGNITVRGSILTLAHHGKNSSNPAPCVTVLTKEQREQISSVEDDLVIGISHMDLDTLGGILNVLGETVKTGEFWKLAAFADLNGPHMIHKSGARWETQLEYFGFCKLSQENRIFAPRDGSVEDITDKVKKLIEQFKRPLAGLGENFIRAQHQLDHDSYCSSQTDDDGIRYCIRISEGEFVNQLYTFDNFEQNEPPMEHDAVLSYNKKTGAITLSFATAELGLSARNILQKHLGPKAGGHDGIAGGDRRGYNLEDFFSLVQKITGRQI